MHLWELTTHYDVIRPEAGCKVGEPFQADPGAPGERLTFEARKNASPAIVV
jgi:hypothetical protein